MRATTEPGRCPWCGDHVLYRDYHDSEWGVPCGDDDKLFEFLVLESAQAGLSWLTILRKREGYRAAFAGFDAGKVARYSERKITALVQDPAIVRNRAKISSAVNNARAFLEVQADAGSFAQFIWQFVEGAPIQNRWRSMVEVPATTAESDALSKELKRRGFRFAGSTICYAYMQAMGLVNDHLLGCYRHAQCRELAETFTVGGR